MSGPYGERLSAGSVLACVFALVPSLLPAQSMWAGWPGDNSYSIEILNPLLRGYSRPQSVSSVFFVTYRGSVTPPVRWVMDFPGVFMEATMAGNEYDCCRRTYRPRSGTVYGNPYLGIEVPAGRNGFLEIGLRIPVTPGGDAETRLRGAYSDLDRLEAFGCGFLPFQMSFNFLHADSSGLVMRLRGGPDVWITTDSRAGANRNQLLFHYGVQLGYEGQRLSVSAGVTGKMRATGERLTLDQRTFHQMGITAGVHLGRYRPGLHLRVPLDGDLKKILDYVIGFNFTMQL